MNIFIVHKKYNNNVYQKNLPNPDAGILSNNSFAFLVLSSASLTLYVIFTILSLI